MAEKQQQPPLSETLPIEEIIAAIDSDKLSWSAWNALELYSRRITPIGCVPIIMCDTPGGRFGYLFTDKQTAVNPKSLREKATRILDEIWGVEIEKKESDIKRIINILKEQ